MRQVHWKQKIFVKDKLVAEIDKVSTIGEKYSRRGLSPTLEYTNDNGIC